MIRVRVDETAYSLVAKGLVRRVVKTLIGQFADIGVLDLSQELSDEGLAFVDVTAFGVLVQFEDFRGHSLDGQRHPPVVGFMSVAKNGKLDLHEPEEILISPRRTDLHGGVDKNLIREVFKELQKRQSISHQDINKKRIQPRSNKHDQT